MGISKKAGNCVMCKRCAAGGRPIMHRSIDPLISASRGTLAGDLLWLGAIGFIIAIITGMIG
jgi:hypothetical protein